MIYISPPHIHVVGVYLRFPAPDQRSGVHILCNKALCSGGQFEVDAWAKSIHNLLVSLTCSYSHPDIFSDEFQFYTEQTDVTFYCCNMFPVLVSEQFTNMLF